MDGQQYREILRLFFRKRQSQVKLTAALNHVLQDLIDRILIFARQAATTAHLFSKAVQEGGGTPFIRMGKGIGKRSL